MNFVEGENSNNSVLDKWSVNNGFNTTIFALVEIVNTVIMGYVGYTQEMRSNAITKQDAARRLSKLNNKFKKESFYLNYLYDLVSIDIFDKKTIKISHLLDSLNSLSPSLRVELDSGNVKDLVLTDEKLFCRSVCYLFGCFSRNSRFKVKLRRNKKLSLRFQNQNNLPFNKDLAELIIAHNKNQTIVKKEKLNIIVANLCLELLKGTNCQVHYNSSSECIYFDLALAKQMNVFEVNNRQ